MKAILLRYGEIGLKSKRTRSHFEKRYIEAIKEALLRNGVKDFTISNYGGRFIIFTENDDAPNIVINVPGVESLAKADYFQFENKVELLSKIKNLAKLFVRNKTFGVKVKRVGQHDFTSQEIGKESGDVLFEFSAGVNLTNPDIFIFLEIRNNECFVYTESITGIGGLPPKSSGKVLALFSGGIDSPIAAYKMLKRGCQVDFCLLNLRGKRDFNDVAKVYNYLTNKYSYSYTPKIFVIDGQNIVKNLKEKVPDNLRQIALKISLYRLGEKIANEHGYLALVTGEALSQKSSQTLPSLRLIQSQVTIPILRPLLGMNKNEIINIARLIGTLSASERVKEYCNLSDGPVSTAPTINDLIKIPPVILEEVSLYNGIVDVEDDSPSQIGKSFITVDIRSVSLQQTAPLNLDISLPNPLTNLTKFDKDKSYLLVCDFGVRSEDTAFLLRKQGIKAAGVTIKNYLKYFSSS